jgi:Immunoglobulin I-set domain
MSLVEKPMTRRGLRSATALLAICAVLALNGCGGGGSSTPAPVGGGTPTPTPSPSPSPSPSPTPTPTTGTIVGKAVSTVDDSPIAGADVSIGAISAKTAADGSFQLTGVAPGARVVTRASSASHAPTAVITQVTAGQSTRVRIVLTPVGTTASVSVATGGVVSVPNSPAQVSLPANALVDFATRAPITGAVTVRVTPIDPARDPAAMPGDYLAQPASGTTPSPIESFGAIKVDIRDATGKRVDLAANQTATIRIPVSSRSADVPATIPLYYFDEDKGLWVQEGSASLKGSGANRYYEGTVTHFTTWNCDRPLETIIVRGCVVDAAGNRVAGVDVSSEGLDYSGDASRISNASGDFAVPMRRGGLAAIYGERDTQFTNILRAGPSQTDILLPECLRLNAAGVITPPVIVSPPQSTAVTVGDPVFFSAQAIGTPALRYQWNRNGQAIAGATAPVLFFIAALADNAAVYTVTVSNAAGSVTSAGATLTVNGLSFPVITTQPTNAAGVVGGSAVFNVSATGGSLQYQWRRNGVPISGANAPVYVTPTLALTDNGATFDVVVSNTAGNVTSAAATLTVMPNNTTQQVALIRLAFLGFDFIDLAQASFQTVDDAGLLISSAQTCAAGGSVAATLNGSAITVGAALPAGNNTLAATFTNCAIDSFATYSGVSSAQYNISGSLTGNFTASGTGTMTNMRRVSTDGQTQPMVEADITGNGNVGYTGSQTVAGAQITNEFAATPAAGATLRSALTNLTATAVSGSLTGRGVETVLAGGMMRTDLSRFSASAYTFTVGSNTYVSNGTLEISFNGANITVTGAITVTENGTQIGRIFADATGVLQIEVNGQIVPFGKPSGSNKPRPVHKSR